MITVGIYDQDAIYRKRLMEYLNHQKDYPMKAVSFSKIAQVKEYETKNYLEAMISEENIVEGSLATWIPLGDGKEGTVAKYGNAAEIARYIYHQMNLISDHLHTLIGIYSPIGDRRRTKIALELSRYLGGIYFGMEEYSSLGASGENMEELLFYIKEKREDIISLFREKALDLDGCYGFPSARCYLDYRELWKEDVRWFFERLQEENICLVADIGTGSLGDLEILTLFDQVYVPISREDAKDQSFEHFEELLHLKEELQKVRYEKLWLGKNENLKELVKQL